MNNEYIKRSKSKSKDMIALCDELLRIRRDIKAIAENKHFNSMLVISYKTEREQFTRVSAETKARYTMF